MDNIKEKTMVKNYIKIAFRYLLKNKVFSVINILGLTLGFTCFIVLSLFVFDELGFDSFHTDSDRIYRVIQTITEADGSSRKVSTVAPLIGTEAEKQFPEVLSQTRLIEIGRLTVGNEPLNRDYERIWIADHNFFEFFDFGFFHGNAETALQEPGSIVLTESTALKYFGEADVVGRTLYTNVFEATVTGVIEDFPPNSHLDINTLHTNATWANRISGWKEWVSSNWTSNSFITYYKMQPDFDKEMFEEKLTILVAQNYSDEIEYKSSFELQPLSDIHLYSQGISGGMNVNAGNPLYVYMFSIVALLILAIACFNYMNLSTAAGARRTREVGMRKTLGANRKQLIFQFMGEALILSLFSLLLSLILIELTLPYINTFVGRELVFSADNAMLAGGLLLAVIVSGIVSALYPSIFLSRINPVVALKKEIKIGSGSFSLRKVLVVAQFTVSIVMISTTILIYQQLNFMQYKDLGFKVDNLLVVDINSAPLRTQFESIKQEFGKLSQVQSVSVSSRVPGEWKTFPIANLENSQNESRAQAVFVGVDEDFLDTYNIRLVEGRNLRDGIVDSASVLLSESAVQRLGLENPVGQTIEVNGTLWAGDYSEDRFRATVVGVVGDFHFESFREELSPMILASHRNPIHNIDYYTLRIRTDDWQQTISELKAINYRFDSQNPMEYTFLDSRFEEFYRGDRMRGQLFLWFSGLIVFIACLGLYALASFAVESRIKEIGVRKILGAKVSQIIWLLSREFALLVGAAFMVSVPVSWWAIQNWLQEFSYRIPISWWVFAIAGGISLAIALLTVSFQAVKAAVANPVESLRYE
jgi:putative ABC transport system permease protein